MQEKFNELLKRKTLTELSERMPSEVREKAEAVLTLCPELWEYVQETVGEVYDLGVRDGKAN